MIKKYVICTVQLVILWGGVTAFSWAGGIYLSSTRLIYPADQQSQSIIVGNSDDKAVFLIQSWVEDLQGKKSDDFLVTPPLFLSHAKEDAKLRIIYVGRTLPQDRESAYWLNVKAIPSLDSAHKNDNYLQLAVLSRIKIFYRPKNVQQQPSPRGNDLALSLRQHVLSIKNPTSFYISMVSLQICGKSLAPQMIAPDTSIKLSTSACINDKVNVSYQIVNDYGGLSEKVEKSI